MSRDSRDERDKAIVAAHERLVEALVADLLAASDGEVLASHSPAAARVAADALRRRLHRDAPGAPAEGSLADPLPGASPNLRHRPERKP